MQYDYQGVAALIPYAIFIMLKQYSTNGFRQLSSDVIRSMMFWDNGDIHLHELIPQLSWSNFFPFKLSLALEYLITALLH